MPAQDLFGDVPTPAKLVAPAHTWFFALRPGAADAQRIHEHAETWLAERGITGKRLDAQRLHITLALLGHDVSEAVLAAGCRAADRVSHAPLDAIFDAALTFSAPSGPCVLVGQAGLDDVRRLRNKLVLTLADAGLKPERAYEPHMTLCYDPRHRLARTEIAPVGFRTTEFVLLKSHIGFSRHELIRSWSLTGSGT